MRLSVIPVEGIGEVGPGEDLPALVANHADLVDGDVVVVASKVVSKAAGRTASPQPGESVETARRRLASVEEVLVETPHVIVVRTSDGLVCANAGIDASNVPGGELLVLPEDPDRAAADLAEGLRRQVGVTVGVVVSDTFGRAWREGQTDVALGVAGLPALRDERGMVDRDGATLRVTLVALADQIAGAADLVRTKAAGVPVVILRGLSEMVDPALTGGGRSLVRSAEADLFPHGRGWLARRLATGEGAPVRDGQPAQHERRLVARATGGRWEGSVLLVADGLHAGRAEACLLDLGYDAAVNGPDPWTVTVQPGDRG